MFSIAVEIRFPLWGGFTGGAWLSSARVVRCWVKSRNERNPRSMLPARNGGDSWETAGVNSEEGEDDVKSSCPLCLGLHACYNGRYRGLRNCEVELIPQEMVGLVGLEPTTPALSRRCSNQLSYSPETVFFLFNSR